MTRTLPSLLQPLLGTGLIIATASACGSSNVPIATTIKQRKACDSELLDIAHSAADVEAACEIPADLQASWTCTTPLPASASVAELRELHATCQLDALGSQEKFATANGDPLRSAGVYQWLKSLEFENPEAAALLLVGDSPLLAEIVLPPMPGVAPSEPNDNQLIEADIDEVGGWSAFPGWRLESLSGSSSVQMDEKLTVRTVRYLLASLASETEPLRIMGADQGVTHMPLYLPTALAEPARVSLSADGTLSSEGAPLDGSSPPAEVILELDDTATVAQLTTSMASLKSAKVALALDYAPCATAPEGMVCIPGGGPERLPTYYIDAEPSSDEAACADSGICRSRLGTWDHAREYCTWQGKRLPTSFELERAVSSGVVADPESKQWLLNWEGEGPAPHGTCSGAPRCSDRSSCRSHPPECKGSSKRLLSDGTAASESQRIKGSRRCASSNSWLATFPPADRSAVENQPPVPQPDSELAAIANAIDQDDIMEKGVCGQAVRAGWGERLQHGGRSTMECRDPNSYVTSNEPRRYIWARHFANLGGGYVGVGSDQAYDFIAVARSEWAWVFDYDPNVVRLHQILKPLIQASPTRDEFITRFSSSNAESSVALIVASTEDEEHAAILERFYYGYREKLRRHYVKSLKSPSGSKGFGWLATEDNYGFIHLLYSQNRIVPIGADMLGPKSFHSVGKAAREMGIPIRVYYASNAPTAWGLETDGAFNENYRSNVLALPFDDKSVVLQTFNSGAFGQRGYWHYNVMNGLLFQERMALPGYQHSSHRRGPTWDRIAGHDVDLTLSGLRGQ